MRHRAREHVNAALDRRSALNAAIAAEVDALPVWKRESFDVGINGSVNPLIRLPQVVQVADLGLTARQIEKRDLDEFPGERLTFEQKRARREALSYVR